jgi:hypothetical protein
MVFKDGDEPSAARRNDQVRSHLVRPPGPGCRRVLRAVSAIAAATPFRPFPPFRVPCVPVSCRRQFPPRRSCRQGANLSGRAKGSTAKEQETPLVCRVHSVTRRTARNP